MASLPVTAKSQVAHYTGPDPAAQIQRKSYLKCKAAVSCEILPRTRVAPGCRCRCSGPDLRSIGYWTTSDHTPWRHVTSIPTAQKCFGISRNVPRTTGCSSAGPSGSRRTTPTSRTRPISLDRPFGPLGVTPQPFAHAIAVFDVVNSKTRLPRAISEGPSESLTARVQSLPPRSRPRSVGRCRTSGRGPRR